MTNEHERNMLWNSESTSTWTSSQAATEDTRESSDSSKAPESAETEEDCCEVNDAFEDEDEDEDSASGGEDRGLLEEVELEGAGG